MSYYILSAIFLIAFIFESLVTSKLFIKRDNIALSTFMKWWAIFSLAGISAVNLLGFMRLYQNNLASGLDYGNYVQAAFAFFGLSLIVWVWIFHQKKWEKDA